MKGFFVHYGMYKPGVGTERKTEQRAETACCFVCGRQPAHACRNRPETSRVLRRVCGQPRCLTLTHRQGKGEFPEAFNHGRGWHEGLGLFLREWRPLSRELESYRVDYKIRSHHPRRTVKQKSLNLQNAIFERFIHQVEMMQKMTMTNFNDMKANAAVINNNTQRSYVDGGRPQFAYDVGGGTFHLTPERNSHIPLLDSMSNEQLQDGKRRREEDNFICRDPTLFPCLLYPSGMDVRRSVNRERRYAIIAIPTPLQSGFCIWCYVL